MKWSLAAILLLAGLPLSQGVVRAQNSTILGTVTDGSDVNSPVPLSRVAVEVASTDSSRSATTDLSGRYEFTGLQPGRYTVKFSFRSFGNEERPIVLASDSLRELDVCMAPRDITGAALSAAANITGVVRDNRTCKALGNVQVEVRRRGVSDRSVALDSTTTTPNGTYEFRQLAQDDYTVTFRAENYEGIRSPVEVRLGSAQLLHAYMPPRFRLSEERDEFGISPDITTEIPSIPPVPPECRSEECPDPLPPARSANPHPRVVITWENGSEGATRPTRPDAPTPPVAIRSNRPARVTARAHDSIRLPVAYRASHAVHTGGRSASRPLSVENNDFRFRLVRMRSSRPRLRLLLPLSRRSA